RWVGPLRRARSQGDPAWRRGERGARRAADHGRSPCQGGEPGRSLPFGLPSPAPELASPPGLRSCGPGSLGQRLRPREVRETVEPSDPDRDLRDAIRRFVRSEVAPIATRMDREDWFPKEVFRHLGQEGFLGITLPTEHGGLGLPYTAQAVVLEEIAR